MWKKASEEETHFACFVRQIFIAARELNVQKILKYTDNTSTAEWNSTLHLSMILFSRGWITLCGSETEDCVNLWSPPGVSWFMRSFQYPAEHTRFFLNRKRGGKCSSVLQHAMGNWIMTEQKINSPLKVCFLWCSHCWQTTQHFVERGSPVEIFLKEVIIFTTWIQITR